MLYLIWKSSRTLLQTNRVRREIVYLVTDVKKYEFSKILELGPYPHRCWDSSSAMRPRLICKSSPDYSNVTATVENHWLILSRSRRWNQKWRCQKPCGNIGKNDPWGVTAGIPSLGWRGPRGSVCFWFFSWKSHTKDTVLSNPIRLSLYRY